MGFYAPAQLVRDAREHGVEVRPVDVNLSQWDCTLERGSGKQLAVRLGFNRVRGLAEKDASRIVAKRADRRYSSIEELWRRASVPVVALHGIAKADGYGSLGLSRRQSAWGIKALRDEALPLFAAADDRAAQLRPEITEPAVSLPAMTMGREVVEDYKSKPFCARAWLSAALRLAPVFVMRPMAGASPSPA
jgi:error-prone DNA polymerase